MRAGKTAIATALAVDVTEVQAYQPTRCKGVFDVGGELYTSRAIGSNAKLPDGFEWKNQFNKWLETKYGIEIFKAATP